MKRAAAFLLAAGISWASIAQDSAPPTPKGDAAVPLKEELVAREKASWEAWKNRDGAFFRDFLSDDHVEIGFNGIANKATVAAGVGSPACTVRSYAVDRFALTVFDANTALLTYYADQDTMCGGNPVPAPVWVASLYVRRSGKWWNAAYQQTQTKRKS